LTFYFQRSLFVVWSVVKSVVNVSGCHFRLSVESNPRTCGRSP
jgi:hypothetical protein